MIAPSGEGEKFGCQLQRDAAVEKLSDPVVGYGIVLAWAAKNWLGFCTGETLRCYCLAGVRLLIITAAVKGPDLIWLARLEQSLMAAAILDALVSR